MYRRFQETYKAQRSLQRILKQVVLELQTANCRKGN